MPTPSFLIQLMDPGKLSRNIKTGPEDDISIAFASRLRVWTIERRLNCIWCHVPNEVAGTSNDKIKNLMKIRYAIAKALGLITGTADYLFLSETGGYCIEMKSKTGTQTPNQKKFQEWCKLCNVPYKIARSADEAEQHLRDWGLIK